MSISRRSWWAILCGLLASVPAISACVLKTDETHPGAAVQAPPVLPTTTKAGDDRPAGQAPPLPPTVMEAVDDRPAGSEGLRLEYIRTESMEWGDASNPRFRDMDVIHLTNESLHTWTFNGGVPGVANFAVMKHDHSAWEFASRHISEAHIGTQSIDVGESFEFRVHSTRWSDRAAASVNRSSSAGNWTLAGLQVWIRGDDEKIIIWTEPYFPQSSK